MRVSTIEIVRDGQFVSAMGHRVADREGGDRELKRRCLETLSRYDCPPDDIRFTRTISPSQAPPPAELEARAEAEVSAAAQATDAVPSTVPARPQRSPGVAKAKDRAKAR
ncbi:MAG: hypothetical protein RL685_4590 [Pseudomonadota bacterium]|jgi:hypothetical protein